MDVEEEYSIYISARPWLKFPRKRHLARGGIPWERERQERADVDALCGRLSLRCGYRRGL